MRITTQMLNESAKRAGLPVNRMSLLDCMNGEDTGNALLDALNSKNQFNPANFINKSKYEKIGESADNLSKSMEIFTAEGKNSIFEKISDSEDKKELYSGVEDFVENYNDTFEKLQTSSDSLNGYYRQMMKEAVSENEEALEEIGITLSKDGTLNIDKDKLKNADVESIKKVFDGSTSLIPKLSFLAERISNNADANVESLSSQYNSSGNIYSALSGKYDLWG